VGSEPGEYEAGFYKNATTRWLKRRKVGSYATMSPRLPPELYPMEIRQSGPSRSQFPALLKSEAVRGAARRFGSGCLRVR
jgi:hypothetical protein